MYEHSKSICAFKICVLTLLSVLIFDSTAYRIELHGQAIYYETEA